MTELAAVLTAFRNATQCEAAVYTQASPEAKPVVEATTEGALSPAGLTLPEEGIVSVDSARGRVVIAAVPGPRRAWFEIGPAEAWIDLQRYMPLMLPVVSQYLQSALEVEHAANELAERYEEINLLYTISEILGRTVSLEEGARTILTEISETVGARRASILVHDPATDSLRVVAALGVDPARTPAIRVDDPCSVSARVFRTQHPLLAEGDQMLCEAEAPYRRGSMLSVPI